MSSRAGTGAKQPSILVLGECLKLISMNRDEAFELDTFVGVHEFANGLHDQLAGTSGSE